MLSTAGMTWRLFAVLRADGVCIVPLALSAHAASEKSVVAVVASVVAAVASVVAAVASVTRSLLTGGGGGLRPDGGWRFWRKDVKHVPFLLSSKDDL